jgi:hypothetical protein
VLAPVVLRAERLAPRMRAAFVGTVAIFVLSLLAPRLARRKAPIRAENREQGRIRRACRTMYGHGAA